MFLQNNNKEVQNVKIELLVYLKIEFVSTGY